jgi:hypothetical protein
MAKPRARLRCLARRAAGPIALTLGVGAASLAAVALATPALAARPGVASCALGRLPSSLRGVLPDALAREQERFASSRRGLSSSDRSRATKAFATGATAYIYGMPTVLLRLTVKGYPVNRLIGVGQLATPDSRTVVAPNHDTLYSVSQVDLSAGPLMIDAPATHGRYSVLQLLAADTNVVDYVGSGSERNHAATVALLAPGWKGTLPAGVRVVRSPTTLVWLLGRTLVDGPADLAAATRLMADYSLTPLSDWTAGRRNPEIVLESSPRSRSTVKLPRGLSFYDALGQAFAADALPARDACALRAFARYGIAAGQAPSRGGDPVIAKALAAGAGAGDRLVDLAASTIRRDSQRHHGGWAFSPPDTARFVADYAGRAAVARDGLAANTRSEALYSRTDSDSRGRPLDGHHDYVVSFRAGRLPPVRAFWSLTLYDSHLFLVPNPLQRYAIGDRTAGLRYGSGHSLKVYVQHKPPRGARRANWLPAPAGRFRLNLRLYEPKPAATNGAWKPPKLSRTR